MRTFLLFFALGLALPARAAFDEDSLRYFSPWDLVFKLKDTFPARAPKAAKPGDNPCASLSANAAELGASEPATGSPVSNGPSPLAIRWIEVCTNALTKQSFAPDASAWAKKNAAEQKQILARLLHQILGEDEVIRSYGNITDVDAFVERARTSFAKEKLSTFAIERRWALALTLRDEFLSY